MQFVIVTTLIPILCFVIDVFRDQPEEESEDSSLHKQSKINSSSPSRYMAPTKPLPSMSHTTSTQNPCSLSLAVTKDSIYLVCT